jgi:hypothetical protein
VLVCRHHQLLVGRAGAEFRWQRSTVGEQELRDILRDRHVVDAFEQPLELSYDHGSPAP